MSTYDRAVIDHLLLPHRLREILAQHDVIVFGVEAACQFVVARLAAHKCYAVRNAAPQLPELLEHESDDGALLQSFALHLFALGKVLHLFCRGPSIAAGVAHGSLTIC